MEFHTRGIHYFAGRVVCPFAGIGTRAADASNRLALDDDSTTVAIDRDRRTITIRNDRSYGAKTTLADLTFLAVGTTPAGERAPCTIHLKVDKSGGSYDVDLHPHVRDLTRIVRAEFEPFQVTVLDEDRSILVLDPARATRTLTEPSFALKVAMAMLSVTDHSEGVTQDPAEPGYRVADLSVGVGALGLRYQVVRVRLVSLDASNAPLIARGSVVDMLREGAWELELAALSARWLTETIQRDLFLFGLDEVPLLRDVRAHGLRKGQRLAFRIAKDRGEIVLDGQAAPLAGAHDVARAYLEFHALGGLLAHAAERRR
jgi:hypothetical protein